MSDLPPDRRFPVDAQCGHDCGPSAQVTLDVRRAMGESDFTRLQERLEAAVDVEFEAFDIEMTGWFRTTHTHAS